MNFLAGAELKIDVAKIQNLFLNFVRIIFWLEIFFIQSAENERKVKQSSSKSLQRPASTGVSMNSITSHENRVLAYKK